MINKDIFSIVFRYLPLGDRVTCLTVCREWTRAAAEFNEWTNDEYMRCLRHNLLYFVQHTNVDPSFEYNRPIRYSANYGRVKCVQILLADRRVNPSDLSNDAIHWAAFNGHTEIVKLLITDPRFDSSRNGNHAIKWASFNGHIEIVKILLADPNIFNSATVEAQHLSVRRGYTEITELLKAHKK